MASIYAPVFARSAPARQPRWGGKQGVENLQSPLQPVGVGRKQLFHGYGPGNDPLLKGVLDYLLERLPVGCDAVGQGIAAGDLHDLPVRVETCITPAAGGHVTTPFASAPTPSGSPLFPGCSRRRNSQGFRSSLPPVHRPVPQLCPRMLSSDGSARPPS